MLFGWPKWAVRLTGVLELVCGASLLLSPWGLVLAGVPVGGALVAHGLRQRSMESCIPPLVVGAFAAAGLVWLSLSRDSVDAEQSAPGPEQLLPAVGAGIIGALAFGRLFGHQPSPESFYKLHASVQRSKVDIREMERRATHTARKGAKAL